MIFFGGLSDQSEVGYCLASPLSWQRSFSYPHHSFDISLLSPRSLLLIQGQEIQGDVDTRSAHGRHPAPRSVPWSGSLPWGYAGPQPRALPRLLSQYNGPQPGTSLIWTLPAGALRIRPGQHAPPAQSEDTESTHSPTETLYHY